MNISSNTAGNVCDISPKEFPANAWIDDMKRWPEIEYGDIYNYLISSHACDGEEMKNFKSFDSFIYFKSGCVGKVTHVLKDDLIVLKCDVRPSQRVNNDNHHPWAVCSENGTIHTGGCTCMAGSSKTCSHVGALLWKIEYAVKRGFTGQSCTDTQAKWNQGTSRNIEPSTVAEMDFKKPKLSTPVTFSECQDPVFPVAERRSSYKQFVSHDDFTAFVDNSNLKPLFSLQNSMLNASFSAKIKENLPVNSVPHSAHTCDLTCTKCENFYRRYVELTPTQIKDLNERTVCQAESELWHESRKLRITGSSAHKVPVRDSTNPDNFVREHIYPTFRGNMYTRHGQEGEIKAKEQLRADGYLISEVGTFVCETEPWLSVSPDGIIKETHGDELLEIKCPFLKEISLDDLLQSGKYDVVKQGDNVLLKEHGQRGYFLQVQLTLHVMGLQNCKFVVFTPDKYVTVCVPYDKKFCHQALARLRAFYFSKFLSRVVDDFESGRLKLSLLYSTLTT